MKNFFSKIISITVTLVFICFSGCSYSQQIDTVKSSASQGSDSYYLSQKYYINNELKADLALTEEQALKVGRVYLKLYYQIDDSIELEAHDMGDTWKINMKMPITMTGGGYYIVISKSNGTIWSIGIDE